MLVSLTKAEIAAIMRSNDPVLQAMVPKLERTIKRKIARRKARNEALRLGREIMRQRRAQEASQ